MDCAAKRWLSCLAASLVACAELEPPQSALNCVECLPACAADVDIDDLEGSARRIGCDPLLVQMVRPAPGWVVTEDEVQISAQFAQAMLEQGVGEGCDGPIRVRELGAVNAIPAAIAADIITHASLRSLPLWPRDGDCVPGTWSAHESTLRFVPSARLRRFTWYEVRVAEDLGFAQGKLCSELSWRFTVSACGDGVIDSAQSFTDWVCLGHVEAQRGWFDPYEEECDDGNHTIQDGCSPTCVNETGFACDATACHTRCGDGIRAGQEQCDFGIAPPPGCRDCVIEPGYTCRVDGCMPDSSGP